jgi:PAS domain S-box-containing protein
MEIHSVLADHVRALETENELLRAQLARPSLSGESNAPHLSATLTEGGYARLQLLQAILDSLPSMIGYWDRNLRNRFCNRAYYKWFGLTPAQALGKHIREVIGEERYRLNLPYIEGALRGERQQFERAIPTPDGRQVRHSLAEYIPDIVDDAVIGFFVHVSDVTPLKEAEAVLRRSEESLEQLVQQRTAALRTSEANLRESDERFRVALADTPVVVFEQDLDLRYTWICNPKISLSADEIIGQTDADIVDPACSAMLTSIKSGVMATGLPARQEVQQATSDGEPKFYDLYVEPRRDRAGQIIGVICAATDITQHKQAENRLRAATLEAQRANNAKSRFLAAASHDLRQPLTALRLYADAIMDKVLPPHQALMHSMQGCITNLSGLLTDLLDLSKLEAGVVKPKIVDFSVFELLGSLESVYRLNALEKGLQLRFVPPRLIGRSDPVLFKRILGNLIQNAIRYTERGGVIVGCRRRWGKAWIEVWDSGIGISADKTAEIFEEFRQLGDEARNLGSGLGLAIVAKTAALLGLDVSVRSEPGRGSVFALELPLGHAEGVIVPLPYVDNCRSLCIALVEDNPMVRDALVIALQRSGHQVIAAANGSGLMAELGSLAPDIIVSDYRLAQGENGFDVIAAVRACLRTDLPAIIITGDTDPNLIARMSGRGIAILHKPLDMDEFSTLLVHLTTRATAR